MSKIILKYHSGLEFLEKVECILKFQWSKCLGAFEFGCVEKAEDHIIDHISKYDGMSIPLTYHSEMENYQIFVLDVIEVERYLKLKQLDI